MEIRRKIPFLIFILNSFLFAQNIPYPQSSKFDSIRWVWDTYKYLADGSDLWPTTWGYDDNIYTSWGDGGGFNGANHLGRVSLGFGRIEGSPENLRGFNVWGGYKPENPATFNGKCNAIISVDSILYAWINTQTPKYPAIPDIKLAWSVNLGAYWHLSNWIFTSSDSLLPVSFINFGKNNQGCHDDYIYIACNKWSLPEKPATLCFLIRVHKSNILKKNKYEYFSGLNSLGNPVWSLNDKNLKPIFTDQNGIDGVKIIYNQILHLYVLTSGHFSSNNNFKSTPGSLGIFTAPEPWGPWSTIAYYNNWGNFENIEENLGFHIPTKWISEDGKTFWMIFSSGSYLDRFNMICGSFEESKHDKTIPSTPHNINIIDVYENEVYLCWSPSTDSESGIKAYKIYRDNIFIAESETTFYMDSSLADNTPYSYQISSLNGEGLESEKSIPFSIKTKTDSIPPRILNIFFKNDSTKLYIKFSEKVDKASAEDICNYQISSGLKIESAELDSTYMTVLLSTSPHARFSSYWIRIDNIFDQASNPNQMKENSINYLYPKSSLLNNLHVHSLSQYELIELYEENESIYIDNNYVINCNDFPEIIANPFIKTAFSDRYISLDDFLSFDLNVSANIYILHDNRIKTKPGWLNEYCSTGIITTIGDNNFTFFEKYYKAGKVTLGGNVVDGELCDCGMYIVIIKPAVETNTNYNAYVEKDFKLFQNYPNPFNPTTSIKYSLPETGKVILQIYNSLGEKIFSLREEIQQTGNYLLKWNGKDNSGMTLASGIYFCELIFQGTKFYKTTNKMIIMK